MRFRAVGNVTFAVLLAGAVIGSGIPRAQFIGPYEKQSPA